MISDGYSPSSCQDYEEYVGVSLNANRMNLRRAYYLALGIQAANGTAELDFEWFSAVSDDDESAGELAFTVNANRQTAELRAKRKR